MSNSKTPQRGQTIGKAKVSFTVYDKDGNVKQKGTSTSNVNVPKSKKD